MVPQPPVSAVRPRGPRGTPVTSAGWAAPSWPCAGPTKLTRPWTWAPSVTPGGWPSSSA